MLFSYPWFHVCHSAHAGFPCVSSLTTLEDGISKCKARNRYENTGACDCFLAVRSDPWAMRPNVDIVVGARTPDLVVMVTIGGGAAPVITRS